MNRTTLRKALRKAINESRWEDKSNHKQLGYGSGRHITDMSDEIMMIIEHTLELGDKSGATEAPEFIEEVKAVATRTIEAAIQAYRKRQ